MKIHHDPIPKGDVVMVQLKNGYFQDDRFREVEQYWAAHPDARELRIWRGDQIVRRIVRPKERARRRIMNISS
jgi:hypothetical protein